MATELVETVVALCGYGTTKSCDISPCFQRGALAFLRIDFLILDTLPYFRHLFNFFFLFQISCYTSTSHCEMCCNHGVRGESHEHKNTVH